MTHTIAQTWRKLAAPVAFLVFFLLLGANQATAQSSMQPRSSANPQSRVAQKFGVTAYNLGSWTSNNVIQALIANTPNIKGQTNAPLASRVKYEYYQLVLNDVKNYNIAPEIAMLTNLAKVKEMFKTSSAVENVSFLSGIYNSTVGLF